ncbi:amidohydrolase [Colletotrichum navitas]|uniref:Amidohydrolase n=1 Tax=Colletotrichum navitas TaxID=681940 RepID=A0AAD8V9H8_9PEZI|nr:amidohydrolase [Colletotrichum navitas]KAK1596811.1 amidohydrolase [Colletotrichum navitas]
MTKIFIKNVRVFDSEVIREAGNVVFTRSAGNIQDPMADGSEAETSDCVVDGRGCSLLPGFIDVYANIKGANAALGSFASYGVTTVIDLSSNTQQCQALQVYAAGRTGLPTFFTSGTGATSAKDCQTQLYDSPYESIISTCEDAMRYVSARSSGPDRADFIKVVVDIYLPTDEILKTIVGAAHAHGKLTIARTAGKASYERAMLAGFDIFAHAPLDAALDPAMAREMAAQGKVFVPTLGMMWRRAQAEKSDTSTAITSDTGDRDRPDHDDNSADTGSRQHTDPGASVGSDYNNATATVRTLHDAGVTICAGTTANLIPGVQIPFGESLHEELRLLVDAGMPRLDVLRSATCVAAKAFRLSDRGIIRGGLRADLVLVEGNPLEDINATRNIRRIWIQGEEVDPKKIAA